MAKSFVFLEITDPEINWLIQGIREIAGGKAPRSNVHITIRGPYSKAVPAARLRAYERVLWQAPLLLDGYGTFRFADRSIVYLNVFHPELRRLWWKPDFPIETFGFNPHITLYEGHDHQRAMLLEAFLRREGVKLLVTHFKVTSYVSDHKDLFPSDQEVGKPLDRLGRAGLVRMDVFGRLTRCLAQDSQVA